MVSEHFDDTPQIRNTSESPFSEPSSDSSDFHEKTLQGSPSTYTYYEQLNGYDYLKHLDIGYYFYNGSYVDDILKVLDPSEKTIVHIPNVNSRESTKDKIKEVEHILEELGEWRGQDEETGFHLVDTPNGTLRIADLVDDDPRKRGVVSAALRDPSQKDNRDHVDIIIALGMAKEGFDWIWCEHALTVGYRSSLTEIVQIIGRATRDAPGKERARFTNLIAEPDASEGAVTEAVNDTLWSSATSCTAITTRFAAALQCQRAGLDGFRLRRGNYTFGYFRISLRRSAPCRRGPGRRRPTRRRRRSGCRARQRNDS